MKLLFYEDPTQHGYGQGRTLCKCMETMLGIKTNLVKTVEEADSKLKTDEFDLVLIHHTDFDVVNLLRKNHPDVKYAGYSNSIDENYKDGSITDAMINKMKEFYDYVPLSSRIDIFTEFLKANNFI